MFKQGMWWCAIGGEPEGHVEVLWWLYGSLYLLTIHKGRFVQGSTAISSVYKGVRGGVWWCAIGGQYPGSIRLG